MTVKCPKCGETTDYSYFNKCKCGCEYLVMADKGDIVIKVLREDVYYGKRK